MAFYSLIAQDKKTQRWRTCAIFQAGSQHSAALQAKALRESHALGFVPYPTNFKMRNTSRREMFLLTSYLNSVDNSHIETFRPEELESFLRRRRKLMMSFFLGLFHDPEGMKRRFSGETGGKPITLKNSTSGGVETELEETQDAIETSSNDQKSSGEVNEATGQDASETNQNGSDTSESVNESLTDASEQEAALAALLSSDEATSSNDGNSGEIDLDFY